MRITILGSGTSHGVPAIGCACSVCVSPDPRDTRTRCAIAVEWRDRVLLVDTPPELRQQVIRSQLRRVDAVLLTHAHADHIFGMDDLRRFNELQRGSIPVFSRPETLRDVERAFQYVFTPTQVGGGKPRLDLTPLHGDRLAWEGLEIEVLPVWHGRLPVLAFRFGDFAYVTDTNRIPPETEARLQGLDTLVLDGLRFEPHGTHFNIPQALQVIERLRPRRAYLTHLAHTVPHAATERNLPAPVRLAYDGLLFTVPD